MLTRPTSLRSPICRPVRVTPPRVRRLRFEVGVGYVVADHRAGRSPREPGTGTEGGQMYCLVSRAALLFGVGGGSGLGRARRGDDAVPPAPPAPGQGRRRVAVGPVVLGVLLALVAAALTPAPALAVTKTWVGGGTTGTGPTAWSNGFNWLPLGAPSAGDDLVFPAGGSVLTTDNDLAAGTMFNS